MPQSAARWLEQSPMSDPRRAAALYDTLPTDMAGLCRAVQGLLIHADWTSAYGLSASHFGPDARATLPLERRLADIAQTDPRPLAVERPILKRAPGTCRDFALMLCSVLRYRGIPARVRCGFAAYFTEPWEDHWVCEHWVADERRWRRMDAQLDDVQRRQLGAHFDITDVPADLFVTAGEAWRRCRTGETGGESFGHGSAKGLWFVRVNVVRDHYAINQAELSPWDSWRQATAAHHTVSESDRSTTDRLAEQPEIAKVELTPPWLVARPSTEV